MANHEVSGTYRGVSYEVDHIAYKKHRDDAQNDAQADIDAWWNTVTGDASNNTLSSMLQTFQDGGTLSGNVYSSALKDALDKLDADSFESMVSNGKITRDQADMLIVMRGLRQCGVTSPSDISAAMANFVKLNDSDRAFIVEKMSATNASFKADYQLKGASEHGDDLRHESYSNTDATGTMKNIGVLLTGMSADTATLLHQGDALGLGDSPVQEFIDMADPDLSVLSDDQKTAWANITTRKDYAHLTDSEATSLQDIFAAEVDAEYGPGRFATDIGDARATGLLTAASVSNNNQATIAQMNAMLQAATSLTDNQRSLLFEYYTSGGTMTDSSDLDAAKLALTNDTSLTDADKSFLTDQLAAQLIPNSSYGFDNQAICYALLNGGTITSQQSDYVAQLRANGTYVAPAQATSSDDTVDSTTLSERASGYNTVDVDQTNSGQAVSHFASGWTDDSQAIIQAMVAGNLSGVQMALLQTHLSDPGVTDSDRDVICSAIANSGGNPTVLGGTASQDQEITSAQIDTAIGDMDNLGLSEDDMTALKQAMLNGTLTPAQGNLLLAHVTDANMTSDDATVVTTAVITSRANAEQLHGAQWDEETTDHKDYDGDGVIGNPWDVGPNDVKNSGLTDTDTMDLASLMFQVMQGRCEALDSTVRSYAKTVQEKNDQIKTLNAAVAAVPTTTTADKPVDISKITFTDPVSGGNKNLADYLKEQGISLPTSDGSTSLTSTQLGSLRTSMDNASTSLSSDSQLAMTQLQQAMDKYSTSVSMLTNFLSKWYEMLGQIAAKMGQ